MDDLEKANLTWLYEVSLLLNSAKDSVAIALDIPVGGTSGATAHFTETLKLDEKVDPELHRTARAFASACVTSVMNRTVEKGEIPCLKCSSPCCARIYNPVPVSEEDISFWREAGTPILVDYFESGPRFNGYVGTMHVKPYDGPGKAGDGKCCIHLDDGWCDIWEHRPHVCRQYTWWTCDQFEEHPGKDLTHRLKVTRG